MLIFQFFCYRPTIPFLVSFFHKICFTFWQVLGVNFSIISFGRLPISRYTFNRCELFCSFIITWLTLNREIQSSSIQCYLSNLPEVQSQIVQASVFCCFIYEDVLYLILFEPLGTEGQVYFVILEQIHFRCHRYKTKRHEALGATFQYLRSYVFRKGLWYEKETCYIHPYTINFSAQKVATK